MLAPTVESGRRGPWNKGKLVGQKSPLKLKEIWAIRVPARAGRSQARAGVVQFGHQKQIARLRSRATARPRCRARRSNCSANHRHATENPATGSIRNHGAHTQVGLRMDSAGGTENGGLPVSEQDTSSPHLSTRQYARIVETWVAEIGLDVGAYGTHSMRRTKPSLIYRRTKNLRAVQLLLGHTKLESTVRYLGVEVDDALEMAEQTEV